MKTKIRPGIVILMCNYAAVKMDDVGCLVPMLQSEELHRRGMQLLKKMHCLYVATLLSAILPCYIQFF